MILHTVLPGETLYSIAARYGVSTAELIENNAPIDPDRPTVGRSLIILRPRELYTVKAGDTPEQIAQSQGISLRELYRNNPRLIDNPDIYPGEELVLSYEGEKLGDILSNGYAYSFISPSTQRKSLPYLTNFTLFTYGFDEQGNLIAPTPDDAPVIRLALAEGSAPILLLSTLGPDDTFDNRLASALFSNPAAIHNLTTQLLTAMAQKRSRAVDIDFEYVLPADKEGFVAFVNTLGQALRANGYELLVALAPKTYASQPGLLYEAHDYPALGAAADAVLLMTYEWGYAFGAPQAIAPIDKVEAVINYALSEIPAERIFLGIPNYGYDWTLPYTPGGPRATTISPRQALELADQYGAEILFDERAASPYFYYTSSDGNQHVVWFEDARSYDRKFRLLAEKGLAGFSIWTVMSDTPALLLTANSLFDIL